MSREVRILVLFLFAVVLGRADAVAQYTIRRAQPQREEVAQPTLRGITRNTVETLSNDYYDHAAWVAERNRKRKERNLFEIEGSFQTSALQFENWTAGGDNTFSGLATLFVHHRYKHSWSYSATINFRTQFGDGYESRTNQTLISAVLSPGFLDVSVGFTFAPSGAPYKITLSPIAGNMISMIDDRLYMQGLNGVPAGDRVYSSIGPSLNASFDKKFWGERMRYRSTLYAFTNLTSPPTVRWDNWLDFNLSKYLSIKLYGVVYYLESASPKAQYQYSATLGLSYKFRNK